MPPFPPTIVIAMFGAERRYDSEEERLLRARSSRQRHAQRRTLLRRRPSGITVSATPRVDHTAA